MLFKTGDVKLITIIDQEKTNDDSKRQDVLDNALNAAKESTSEEVQKDNKMEN